MRPGSHPECGYRPRTVAGIGCGIRTRVWRLRASYPSPPRRTQHAGACTRPTRPHIVPGPWRGFPRGASWPLGSILLPAAQQATNPALPLAMLLLSPRPVERSFPSMNHAVPESMWAGPRWVCEVADEGVEPSSAAYEAVLVTSSSPIRSD